MLIVLCSFYHGSVCDRSLASRRNTRKQHIHDTLPALSTIQPGTHSFAPPIHSVHSPFTLRLLSVYPVSYRLPLSFSFAPLREAPPRPISPCPSERGRRVFHRPAAHMCRGTQIHSTKYVPPSASTRTPTPTTLARRRPLLLRLRSVVIHGRHDRRCCAIVPAGVGDFRLAHDKDLRLVHHVEERAEGDHAAVRVQQLPHAAGVVVEEVGDRCRHCRDRSGRRRRQ